MQVPSENVPQNNAEPDGSTTFGCYFTGQFFSEFLEGSQNLLKVNF